MTNKESDLHYCASPQKLNWTACFEFVLARGIETTSDEDKVTCRKCKKLLRQRNQGRKALFE